MKRISRGLYKLGKEKNFQPLISNELASILERLKTTFPFADFCIWQTSEINQFTQHISKENFTIIEVEKEVKSSVFSFLKEEQSKPVFMNVDEDIMNLYVRANSHSIILKDIISEAPTQFIEEIETITIEKLLVDIYSDRVIFQSFQGNELKHIFRNAFRQYTINRSKLERYAARRGKKEKINEHIDQNIGK